MSRCHSSSPPGRSASRVRGRSSLPIGGPGGNTAWRGLVRNLSSHRKNAHPSGVRGGLPSEGDRSGIAVPAPIRPCDRNGIHPLDGTWKRHSLGIILTGANGDEDAKSRRFGGREEPSSFGVLIRATLPAAGKPARRRPGSDGRRVRFRPARCTIHQTSERDRRFGSVRCRKET